jgi:hypothetical protein
MVDREMLELNMKCPICLTIADDPCESSCCGHLFCSFCVKKIKYQKCPICRDENVEFSPNIFVKNIMKELKVECRYGCNEIINLSDLKIHRFYCNESKFNCTIEKCEYVGERNDILAHLKEKHCDKIMLMAENFPKLKTIFDKLSIYNVINKYSVKEKIRDICEILEDKNK